MKTLSKFRYFHSRNCAWSYRLQVFAILPPTEMSYDVQRQFAHSGSVVSGLSSAGRVCLSTKQNISAAVSDESDACSLRGGNVTWGYANYDDRFMMSYYVTRHSSGQIEKSHWAPRGWWVPFANAVEFLAYTNLNSLVLKREYFETTAIPRLLMPWLLTSPVHQQPSYWIRG